MAGQLVESFHAHPAASAVAALVRGVVQATGGPHSFLEVMYVQMKVPQHEVRRVCEMQQW